MDETEINALVTKLSRPHSSGGVVIERAAILAAGSDFPAVMDWITAHAGAPDTVVAPTRSRGLHGPRVSDDNPYAEALFRTAKYRPEFPVKGFAELDTARQWAAAFVHWYNDVHRHSGIKYVTPAQRHAGDDRPMLTARHELYQCARRSNPTPAAFARTR